MSQWACVGGIKHGGVLLGPLVDPVGELDCRILRLTFLAVRALAELLGDVRQNCVYVDAGSLQLCESAHNLGEL